MYTTAKVVTSGTVCRVQYVTIKGVTLMAQRCRHPSFHVVSRHCCPGSTIAVDAPGIAKVSYSLLRLVFDETPPTDRFGLMGTNIHRVLIFAWVLLFRKLVARALIGSYIHRVLVIDGYLYSRVYGSTKLYWKMS